MASQCVDQGERHIGPYGANGSVELVGHCNCQANRKGEKLSVAEHRAEAAEEQAEIQECSCSQMSFHVSRGNSS